MMMNYINLVLRLKKSIVSSKNAKIGIYLLNNWVNKILIWLSTKLLIRLNFSHFLHKKGKQSTYNLLPYIFWNNKRSRKVIIFRLIIFYLGTFTVYELGLFLNQTRTKVIIINAGGVNNILAISRNP